MTQLRHPLPLMVILDNLVACRPCIGAETGLCEACREMRDSLRSALNAAYQLGALVGSEDTGRTELDSHVYSGEVSAYAAVAIGAHAGLAGHVLKAMRRDMTERERVLFLQILTDYFCSRCGKAQPPGDCQCGNGTSGQ